MIEKPPQSHNKSRTQPKQPARAAAAARDPGPEAKNRPGFDLGGAVGDAKPGDRNRVQNSSMQGQGSLKEAASRTTGAAEIEQQGRTSNAADKMRSAVAGVRNWLRGK